MLLLNYDFFDIHFVLTMLRAKPEKEYNIEIIKAVLEVLSTPQVDNTIDDNIIRKRLRTIEIIDKEDLYWVFVDNIYTYGQKIIKDERCYSFLANGFQMMLENASSGDFNVLKIWQMHCTMFQSFLLKGVKISKKQ